MKILHLTDHLPGYHKVWGGAEQVAYRYIKLQIDGENEIIVGVVKPEKIVAENLKIRRIRVLEDFFPDKYQVYLTGIKNRILSFDPVAFINLLWILKKEKPDIVHFHKFNKMSFSTILAASIAGAKIVLGMYDYWYLCPGGMLIDQKRNLCRRFHGPWCAKCDAVSDFRFLLPVVSRLRRPVFDFFLKRIDGFAVLSNSLGKLLEEYGISNEKIFLVRQVFDFKNKTKKTSRAGNGYMILFIGWIDPRKGPDIAIETAKIVANEIPNTKLSIVGEGLDKNYEKKIRTLVVKLKMEKKVIFLGKQPYEKVIDLYNKSKVVLLPEQWENMSPVVLVEAMAYGKPVVASKIGGLPEFIHDGVNGFLVRHNKPDEFAKKVLLLLRNKRKAGKMGEVASREVIRMCDSKKVYESLQVMYKSLIHRDEKN